MRRPPPAAFWSETAQRFWVTDRHGDRGSHGVHAGQAQPANCLDQRFGRPTAISAVFKTPTRSHKWSASRRWRVFNRTVRLSRRSTSRESRTVLAACGSRFAVGSSRNSTRGSWISARAGPALVVDR